MLRAWTSALAIGGVAWLLAGGEALAGPSRVELLSRGAPPSDTAEADEPAVSGDGRFAVFSSTAANLVAGQVDAGASFDIFLHDRQTDTTILVSRSAASPVRAGNGESFTPVISFDGRFVAFGSFATDLVPGQVDTPDTFDVFVFDRVAGSTTLVSRAAGSSATTGAGESGEPSISADGRFLAFVSRATDLVAGQAGPGGRNVFLFDRVADTVTLVSRNAVASLTGGNGESFDTVVSADGRFVAFVSLATDLVAGVTDGNGVNDVFLYDRVAETNTLVSHADGVPATAANGASGAPRISDEGTFLAFVSLATNVVAGQVDTNNNQDVFLYDRGAGTSVLVSHIAGFSATTGDHNSALGAISGDGDTVVFTALATNLVAGQTDSPFTSDVFLFSRTGGGVVTLLSGVLGSATAAASGDDPVISADGQFVAFAVFASNLLLGQADTNDTSDVFLFDRGAGTTRLVSRTPASALATGNSGSRLPRISADGRTVTFLSAATDLVAGLAAGGVQALFVRDDVGGTTTVVSRRDPSLPGVSGSQDSEVEPGGVSADGRHVVFTSGAVNLVPGQVDGNGRADVFLADRQAGTLTLVSRSVGSPVTTGNGDSRSPVISADGRVVAFQSEATDLGQIDTNGLPDIFLFDRESGTTTLVSRRDGTTLTTSNNFSTSAVISADGRFVAFASLGTDLMPGQVDVSSSSDIFLFDRQDGTMTLVSRSTASPVTAGSASSFGPALSTDGRSVAFVSGAVDLVTAQSDVNGALDVFLFDREAATTSLVSREAGTTSTTANGSSQRPVVSAGGEVVAFASGATNLVASLVDGNGVSDVFVYEPATGTMTLVSRTAGSPLSTGNGVSVNPVVSADGRFVAFFSEATDLVAGQVDTPDTFDVFLFDRVAGTTSLISRAAGSVATAANDRSGPATISADGRFVAFTSLATDLVADQADGNLGEDVFLHDRQTGTTVLVSRTGVPRGPARRSAAVSTANGLSGDTNEIPVLSADGRVVAFSSLASDLTADDDFNGLLDVFVWSTSCPGLLEPRPCPGDASRPAP